MQNYEFKKFRKAMISLTESTDLRVLVSVKTPGVGEVFNFYGLNRAKSFFEPDKQYNINEKTFCVFKNAKFTISAYRAEVEKTIKVPVSFIRPLFDRIDDCFPDMSSNMLHERAGETALGDIDFLWVNVQGSSLISLGRWNTPNYEHFKTRLAGEFFGLIPVGLIPDANELNNIDRKTYGEFVTPEYFVNLTKHSGDEIWDKIYEDMENGRQDAVDFPVGVVRFAVSEDHFGNKRYRVCDWKTTTFQNLNEVEKATLDLHEAFDFDFETMESTNSFEEELLADVAG